MGDVATLGAAKVITAGASTSEHKMAQFLVRFGAILMTVSGGLSMLPQGNQWVKLAGLIVGFLLSILALFGYTNSRTAIKTAALGVFLLFALLGRPSVAQTIMLNTAMGSSEVLTPPVPVASSSVAPAAKLASDFQNLIQAVGSNNQDAIDSAVAQLATDSSSSAVTLDGGKITLNWGAATGIDLLAFNKGSNGKPVAVIANQGFGGVLLDFGMYKAADGNDKAHLSFAALLAGGVQSNIATATIVLGWMLGGGGFEHIPLFSVGPAIAIPLVPGLNPTFEMLASIGFVQVVEKAKANG